MRPAMKRWFDTYKSLYAESLDAVQGMTTLKAFNAHERRARNCTTRATRFAKSSIGLMVAASVPVRARRRRRELGHRAVRRVGAMRLAAGHVTVSELFILLLLARECFRPLTDLQHAFHAAYGAPGAAQGVFALLSAPPVLRTPAGASPPRTPGRAPASIIFDDVTFRYRAMATRRSTGCRSRSRRARRSRSSVARAPARRRSSRCCCASSTLDAGTVAVGGTRRSRARIEQLRSRIAVVSQDTFLFHALGRREPAPGAPGRDAGRARAGGPGGERARLHRGAAAGLRHGRRRARAEALRRRAPAPVDRSRAAEGRADPRPRRGHLEHRRRQRGGDPGCAGSSDRRPDDARHRPPPVDGPQRRPDHRARPRAARSRPACRPRWSSRRAPTRGWSPRREDPRERRRRRAARPDVRRRGLERGCSRWSRCSAVIAGCCGGRSCRARSTI